MEYLHTMIRVTDLKATIGFFELMGFVETRRVENEKGRFTLVFLAASGDAERARKEQAPLIELTYNWDPEVYAGRAQLRPSRLSGRRHLRDLQKADGRRRDHQPPAARRPNMAFIRTPDSISIELLQKGPALPAAEPWASMPNTGVW